jgi:hypothetical protein
VPDLGDHACTPAAKSGGASRAKIQPPAPACRARADASPYVTAPAFCSTTCVCASPPACTCSAVWVTSWEPVAVEVEELVPPAPPCVEEAVAVAVWVVGAFWITTWDWPDPPAWVEGAVWVCSAACVTVFELTAVAVAVDVLVLGLVEDPIAAGIQIWISVPRTP